MTEREQLNDEPLAERVRREVPDPLAVELDAAARREESMSHRLEGVPPELRRAAAADELWSEEIDEPVAGDVAGLDDLDADDLTSAGIDDEGPEEQAMHLDVDPPS